MNNMKVFSYISKNQIDKVIEYIEQGNNLEAISLIPIIDLLNAKGISVEQLHEQGALVEPEQLFIKGHEYLESIEKNPSAQGYLERVKEGIKQLELFWKQGKLQNLEQDKKLTEAAIVRLVTNFKNNNLNADLSLAAKTALQTNFEAVFASWVSNELDPELKKEMNDQIVESILAAWKLNELEVNCVTQIKTNIVNLLVKSCFTSESVTRLPEHIYKNLVEKVNEVLIDQIFDQTIHSHKELAEFLEHEKERLRAGKAAMNNKPFYEQAIKAIMQKWLEGRLPESVKESITGFVKNQFAIMQLDGDFYVRIRRNAVTTLLEQFIAADQLDASIQKSLGEYIYKDVITYLESQYTNDANIKSNLDKKIFGYILEEWKDNNVARPVALGIQQVLFVDSRELISEIDRFISPAQIATQIDTMKAMISTLQQHVELLQVDNQNLRQELNLPSKTISVASQKTVPSGHSANYERFGTFGAAATQTNSDGMPTNANVSDADQNHVPKLEK